MNKFITLLFLSTCILTASAQFNKDYTPLVLKGPIPKEIIENVKEKKESTIKSSKDDLSDKQKQEYYTVFSYAIRNYFQSGYIYFNDTFTSYLSRVVKEVVGKENIKGVKIYPSKVDDPNALSWQDGTIFFNITLLNWVDNEAQLAYIISHEITHYTKQHSLMEFQFTHNNRSDVFNKGNEFDKVLSTLSFSRAQELAADEGGFELFSKSRYDKSQALTAMKNIGRISGDEYVEFLSLKDIFNVDSTDSRTCVPDSAYMRNYSKLKSDTASSRKRASTEIETYSTHPNVEERISKIRKMLSDKDSSGNLFLVSEDEFRYLKILAKFENIQHLFDKMDYLSCLYKITQLKKVYPENKYLNVKAAACMYWLAWYKKTNTLEKFSVTSDDETPLSDFVCTIKNMSQREIEKQALKYIKNRLAIYPESEELQIMYAKVLQLNNDKLAAQVISTYLNTNPGGKYNYHAKQLQKNKNK